MLGLLPSAVGLARARPMPGSTVASGDRAADSVTLDSSETEDNVMAQDPSDGEYSKVTSESGANLKWIDAAKRAQRRRQRKTVNEVGLTTSPTTPTPQPQRRSTPKPSPLPRDDFKLVLRPQGGLKIANLDLAEIYLALLNSVNFTWRQANLKVRFDATQNIATITTQSKDAAKALSQVKQIKLGNVIHPVHLYGLAPDDSVKGLIRGVPQRFSEAELLENMDQTKHEIYGCRR